MAYIYIDTAKAIKSSQDIISTAKRLNTIMYNLDHVRLDGILDGSSRELLIKRSKIYVKTFHLKPRK